jgi:hypothetical protein
MMENYPECIIPPVVDTSSGGELVPECIIPSVVLHCPGVRSFVLSSCDELYIIQVLGALYCPGEMSVALSRCEELCII